MKTYRCPLCGSTDFEFQDIAEKTEAGISGVREQSALPVQVQVKCCACHWVGTVEHLAGHH
jgi:hypothetical protein